MSTTPTSVHPRLPSESQDNVAGQPDLSWVSGEVLESREWRNVGLVGRQQSGFQGRDNLCKSPEARTWHVQEKQLGPVWPGPGGQGVGVLMQWKRSASFPDHTGHEENLIFIQRVDGAAITMALGRDAKKRPLGAHTGVTVDTQGPAGEQGWCQHWADGTADRSTRYRGGKVSRTYSREGWGCHLHRWGPCRRSCPPA